MKKNKNLLKKAGNVVLLTGNEAVARGIIEAGAGIAAAFPGTPSTQIVDNLGPVAKDFGFHAEHSVNEAVAFEVAAGSALAGVRSVMVTKMLGVNLIADPLLVIAITGVNAGLVVITADDPEQHSSQNAEDTRYFGMLGKIPVLEPADGQEAKDMTKYAFELSEELQLPVFVRITSRICHSYFDVKLGEVTPVKRDGHFEKDPRRYVMISTFSRARQPILHKKIDRAAEIHSSNPWNKVIYFNKGKTSDKPNPTIITSGIIASGLTYPYVEEVLEKTKVSAKVLKLATTYPLPKQLLKNYFKDLEEVVIIEECDPVTELLIRAYVQKEGIHVRVIGKEDGILPRSGELNPDRVGSAIEKHFGVKFSEELSEANLEIEELLTKRVPALCAGCPHRASYYSIKEALRKMKRGGAILGDRGCYNQGVYEPLAGIDTCICMGASIAMAHGMYKAGVEEPILAVIGDGTFQHSGIPSLLNAVQHKAKITVVIFNNSITAMTGHQPNPGTGRDLMGDPTPDIDLLTMVKGLGVENVKEIESFQTKSIIDHITSTIDDPGPKVIISKGSCAIMDYRARRVKKETVQRAVVNAELCNGCKVCMKKLGCPAFSMTEGEDPHLVILTNCNGCGLCV
ncbi:MAG: indolepyruvate ferredoxin oxidoreductase subunit alpha, partial [Asgard group archaeon]|nr:indolepyruvate ferredoxin oxidoreductase subunit alpha [Asgard group archaeon]